MREPCGRCWGCRDRGALLAWTAWVWERLLFGCAPLPGVQGPASPAAQRPLRNANSTAPPRASAPELGGREGGQEGFRTGPLTGAAGLAQVQEPLPKVQAWMRLRCASRQSQASPQTWRRLSRGRRGGESGVRIREIGVGSTERQVRGQISQRADPWAGPNSGALMGPAGFEPWVGASSVSPGCLPACLGAGGVGGLSQP